MAVVWLKSGDGEKPARRTVRRKRTILREAVAAKAGVILQQAVAKLNPVQGDRGHLARSTWLPWGACIRRRMQPGSNQPRRPVEKTGGEKLNHERRESAWK
jgi:hypothetical protein